MKRAKLLSGGWNEKVKLDMKIMICIFNTLRINSEFNTKGDEGMKKCSHKWTIGMQDFTQYPQVKAEYICLKCKERKIEWYGEKRLP